MSENEMDEAKWQAIRELVRRLWGLVLDEQQPENADLSVIRQAATQSANKLETQQAEKPLTRYDYTQGPFYFLGQQIIRAMNDAGYPCEMVEFLRTPERQAELLARIPPVTKAGPWQSAHQYFCAGDFVHPAKGWNVTEAYWETLAACVRNVGQKFDVGLEHGHYWKFRDSAHVQLEDWRDFKALVGNNVPTPSDLEWLWEAVLPEERRRYMKRQADKGKAVLGTVGGNRIDD